MLNMKHLFTDRMSCKSPFILLQITTKNDCDQHGLQYYDWKYSTVCEDNRASKSNEQHFVANCNKPHQAVVRDCDSTDSNELCGPMWDNIHSNDVMVECRERLNEPLNGTRSDNFTSEHVVNFLFACTFTMILTSHCIEINRC